MSYITSAKVEEAHKLDVLINFVGLRVYDIISEETSYTAAMTLLEETFIKPKNTIFARHLLATSKQEPGENLEQFVQKLQLLAKDCEFTQVTAEQYRDNSIREAFISGISSSTIRQRLLEKKSLDLKSAVELARSLEMAEMAERRNQSFKPVFSAAAAASEVIQQETKDMSLNDSTSASTTNNNQSSKCYFCGLSRHPRHTCPAKDATCRKCQKKGHFAKVCLSKKSQTSTAAAVTDNTPLMIIVAASSISSLSSVTVSVKVKNRNTKALLDTGSTESFISEEVVKKKTFTDKTRCKQNLYGYGRSDQRNERLCIGRFRIQRQSL